MLSNKLTFSLTSLLVLLIIGLCLPASAQTTGLLLPQAAADAGGTPAAGVVPKDSLVVFGNASDAATAMISGRYTQLSTTATNLDDFFTRGGTIELVVPKNSPIAKGKLIFSEIMWGSNAGGADAAAMTATQWIELQNMSGGDLTLTSTEPSSGTLTQPANVYLLFTMFGRETGDTADYIMATDGAAAGSEDGIQAAEIATGTRVKSDGAWTHMVVDRVSTVNVNAFGDFAGTFQLAGQSGNTVAPTVAGLNPQEPLISAQRVYNADGTPKSRWS